jgi:hypothetical protein
VQRVSLTYIGSNDFKHIDSTNLGNDESERTYKAKLFSIEE